MFNSGLIRHEGMAGSAAATVQERLQKASATRAKLAATGEVDYEANADLSKITDEQIAQMPAGLYREGFEYYGKTHFHPNANPRLLMIAGSAADTLYMSEQAIAKATGTFDKKLYQIKGASHIQTYWVLEHVNEALNQLVPFFQKHLGN